MRKSSVARRGFDARTSEEMPAQRTATSRVYQNEDGSRTRRLYGEPVNVRRTDGSWAPVDLALAVVGGGRLAPRLAPYPASFAATAADGDLASLALGSGYEVSFGLLGAASVPGRVSGERVGYAEVQPDADLHLGATATGLKESIVLRSADAPTSYDFELRLRGMTPDLDAATGDIRLVGADGAVRAVVPAGWMRDAKGAESRGVRYRLSRSGQVWAVRVEVDGAWLHDSGRAFPVTVDPSVQINDDADDTYVTSGVPGDHSGEASLKIGNEGSGRISAAYLHFSGLVGSLRNQYINGASLQLYNVDSGTCAARPVSVYAVGAPWSGPTMTTWPGAPLAQHLSQQSFSFGGVGCAPASYAGFPLPADLVTDWTHGTPFHGLSVRAGDEGDTGAFKRFAASQAGNAGVPFLDVTYAPQGADYQVNEVVLPTANRNGQIKATVRNRGSATWQPGGQYKFGFIVKQGGTVVQTSPRFDIPGPVAPNGSAAMNVPMGPLTPGDYQVLLTMYDGNADFQPAYGVPYGMFALRVTNVPPTTTFQQPASGAAVDSIRPTLYAEGIDDDNWPNTGLKYNFKICSGTAQAPTNCTESGWTNATWVPPEGALSWSKTYNWWVQVTDNVTPGAFRGPLQLTTQVPQPEITSHLGGTPQGAPAPGLDPQVGNYGMTGIDAAVATVGPDLTIARTYNSLDPRTTTAFGQGWASRLDTELSEDNDGSGNVVVTLPSGRQVRFGKNADRTYAPPMGQNLTLALATSTGELTLRDATGSQWVFNACGKLRRIIDPNGLVEELEYDTVCPAGKPTGLRNLTSGRRLSLTWSSGHITSVSTDPPAPGGQPLTWTYTYTGDRLDGVCDPAPAPNCTRYGYQSGSHYRSVAVDDNPRAFWRLGETTVSAGAASVTARSAGADKGTYNGVTLGVQGALSGTADTAAAFNGASGRIDLPPKLTSTTMTLAVELWFKTTAGGVLMSYANQPFGSATAITRYTPVLYVGQDGYLRGGFWVPKPDGQRQIVSDVWVADGLWHHVVLSGSIDTQKLYVDGVPQKNDSDSTADDTIKGLIDHDEMPYLTVGVGKTKGWPSGNNGDYYFAGNIDEVAIYHHPLGSTAVAQHYAAARQVQQLTMVTLPQDNRVGAALTYDTVNDRVASYTDHEGRAWRLDAPSRNEAVRQVVLHGPYPDYVFEFDADHGGRPTKRTYDGTLRRFDYNTQGFLSAETDALGHQVTYTTDARGNVLSRTTCRAQGSCQTSYATYFLNTANPLDPRNDRKLTDSDARSTGPTDTRFRTTYGYDGVGRLTSATFPKPAGVSANPTEAWGYSTGTETADGGGSVPAGLLVEHTGRRSGQTTQYLYRSNGDLAEETSPLGLRTRYGHDGIGRRTSMALLGASGQSFGTTTYTYTPRSQIDTVTAPTVTNTVSGVKHTLITHFDYDADGNRTQVTQSDSTGNDPTRTTSFGYNEHDQLVSTTFPDDGRETLEHRNAGMEERVTDPAGTTWISHFDTHGNLLRRTAVGDHVDPEDPNATALVLETRSYDNAGRLATTRDAMGRETRYTYFDDDLPATQTRMGVLQADGQTRRDVLLEQREYDPAGHLTKLTTAGGRVTTASYDPAGYISSTTLDPAGLARTTSYTRGPDGLPAAVDRTGAAQPGRVESTKYRYNAVGQVIGEDVQPVEDDPGSVLSIGYIRDERGLVTERDDRKRLPTNYAYDAFGRAVTVTGPQVQNWVGGEQQADVRPQTTIGYDTFGEVTHTRDPNGAISTIGYDPMGRSSSVQQPDYTPPGGQVIRARTLIDRDLLGNIKATTDPLGRTTTRTFDPYGRLLTETLPQVDNQPSTTTRTYDRDGELASVTDPSGAVSLATYDELGRRITHTAADRFPQQAFYITRTAYDDAGNPVAVTSPAGHTTTATFNAAGEMLTSTDPTNRTTTYTYDIAGRQLDMTVPAKLTTRVTYNLIGQPTATAQLTGNPPVEQRRTQTDYDPNGNLTRVVTPEGRTTTYGYDAADRLVRQDEKVDDTTTIHTTFGYDAAGELTRFVDGNGNATTYTYTPWRLPESTIEPATSTTPDAADRTWTLSYDAVGNPVRKTQPGGVVLTATYDAQSRLRLRHGTGAEAATADQTYDYDAAGRLSGFGGPDGDTLLTYDDRDDLLTTHGPAGDATLTYTADSQLATRTDASGTSTFSYDDAGRPASITDGLSGRTLDSTYDTGGRLAYTAEHGMASIVKRVQSYDTLNRPTGDNVTEFDPTGAPPRVILGTEYGYDLDDNITSKKTITNGVVSANTYGYDGASRLSSWTDPRGTITGYAWDDAGNRTKAGAKTSTYNERNQLLSDGTNTYTYTPRGTLATAGDRTLRFDAFDHLISDGTAYTYDSLDRVASRGGTAFKYGGLGNDVVSDGVRLTSRGIDGEPVADKAIGSTATAKLLYADQHGDVTGRYRGADSFGSRTYDPFGTVTSSSGERTSVGYQDEWTDPATGTVNMHSRWYAPGTGSFTSRDTFRNLPTPSGAANRYTYAGANPLANIDPDGHDFGRIGGGLGLCDAHSGYDPNCDDASHRSSPPPVFNPPPINHDSNSIQGGPARGHGSGVGGGRGGGTGGRGGLGGGGGHISPPPPPPPLWQRNLAAPPPRPAPGSNVISRPASTPSWQDGTTQLIDRSTSLADAATKITEADGFQQANNPSNVPLPGDPPRRLDPTECRPVDNPDLYPSNSAVPWCKKGRFGVLEPDWSTVDPPYMCGGFTWPSSNVISPSEDFGQCDALDPDGSFGNLAEPPPAAEPDSQPWWCLCVTLPDIRDAIKNGGSGQICPGVTAGEIGVVSGDVCLAIDRKGLGIVLSGSAGVGPAAGAEATVNVKVSTASIDKLGGNETYVTKGQVTVSRSDDGNVTVSVSVPVRGHFMGEHAGRGTSLSTYIIKYEDLGPVYDVTHTACRFLAGGRC